MKALEERFRKFLSRKERNVEELIGSLSETEMDLLDQHFYEQFKDEGIINDV